ncbi:hypothetical protein AURDEDRAFT_167675 [Auricularia subglabra TFB-10046 SS5]|nr:hypothetical protein AURDEDRAFT_167675 [Auricularia subglabra TFB-10046 SS5]
MRTIEDPIVRDVPDLIGVFVVIAVDPVASVALLDDETATREASDMLPGRYLALVKGNLHFEWSEARGGPKLTLQFTLAGPGLPAAPNSWASLPISPALPTGECTRPALHPVPTMPWEDCYIYTLHQVSGNISKIHAADYQGPKLLEDDEMCAFTAAYEDQRTFGMARREPRPATVKHDGPARTASTREERQTDREADADAQVQALLEELFQQDDTPRMKPHFQMWFDVSQFDVEQLGQPAAIYAELAQLKRIESEWAQRTVAAIMSKEPETNAWLSGLGDAEAPPVIDSYEAGEHDVLIMPEDAIEHRIERHTDSSKEPYTVQREGVLVRPEDTIEHRMEQGILSPITAREDVPPGSQRSIREQPTTINMDGGDQSPEDSHANRISPSGAGAISVFRVVLKSIASFMSRLRLFMWGLIGWRTPSRKP